MNFRIRSYQDRRHIDRRQKIVPERLRRDSLDRRSNLERRVWWVDRRLIRAVIMDR